jgi:hypothetical protein
MKRLTLLSLVALAAASPLAAQRVTVRDARPLRTEGFVFSNRAVIGVTLDMRPSAGDSLGATLSAVTPAGPAARAGLVAGDIITRFNGTVLVERARGGEREEEVERSRPAMKLLELTSQMSVGDTVSVEYRRERQRRTTRIVAEQAGAMVLGGEPGMRFYTEEGPGRSGFRMFADDELKRSEELRGQLERMRVPGMTGDQFFFRFGGPIGGVQFAPINEDLGRYFGVTDGILVLATPDTSAHVDLKGGDVIVAVDGRKPADVGHLHRILASYQGEETVRFEVMRDRRRVNVEAKAEDLRGPHRVMFDRGLPSRVPMETPAPEPSRPRQRGRTGA